MASQYIKFTTYYGEVRTMPKAGVWLRKNDDETYEIHFSKSGSNFCDISKEEYERLDSELLNLQIGKVGNDG